MHPFARSGYATFGDAVESDILLSYPRTPLVAVARVALSLVVSLSYPLMSHPARTSLLSLLRAAAHRTGIAPPALWSYRAVSAAQLAGTLAVALAVDDLGFVLALVGATMQTPVQYVLPGLCYIRLVRGGPAPKRWLACAQLALDLCLVPTLLYLVLSPR